MIQDGGLVTVFVNDKPVAYSTSCTYEIMDDLREISKTNYKGMGAAQWKEFKTGVKSFTAGAEGLVAMPDIVNAGLEDLTSLLIAGTQVTVKIATCTVPDPVTGGMTIITDGKIKMGQAQIASISASFSESEEATYSVSFTGSGPLSDPPVLP